MLEEGVESDAIHITRLLDMCYIGQSFELIVPYTPAFVDAFHRLHEQRYGYEDSARATQVVNVRIRVSGPSGVAYHPPQEAERPGEGQQAKVDTISMYQHNQWQEAPVYDRQALRPGDCIQGPALVAEYSATTVVPSAYRARIDAHYNLLLQAGG